MILFSKRMELEKEYLEWLRLQRLDFKNLPDTPAVLIGWLDDKGLMK